MRKNREFVQYSERTDVISSVQLVASLVEPVRRHPVLWKWIILGAHNGLQGAMVCNLSGSDGLGALEAKSQAKMRKLLDEGVSLSELPVGQLASFGKLLARIQEPPRVDDGISWCPDEDQAARLAMLHEYRNDFSHYKPMSWSIAASDLPAIIEVALEGTEHLMLCSKAVLRHLTGNQKRALEHSLAKAKRGLALIRKGNTAKK